MEFKLEQIEALRERAHVTYEEAKDALEKSNGDIVEALIYLEKNNKIKEEKANSTCSSLWDKFMALIRKGNRTKFIIKKRENILLSIPVTLAIISTIIAPYFVVIALIIALATGHRIKFQGMNGEGMEINNTLDKVSDFVDNAKENFNKSETSNQ